MTKDNFYKAKSLITEIDEVKKKLDHINHAEDLSVIKLTTSHGYLPIPTDVRDAVMVLIKTSYEKKLSDLCKELEAL